MTFATLCNPDFLSACGRPARLLTLASACLLAAFLPAKAASDTSIGKPSGSMRELSVTATTPGTDRQLSPDTPLLVTVSLDSQQLKLYRGDQLITQSNISSGKSGHATPRGIYSVLEKKRFHRSNIYSNAPMPFMQRLTWSGIALHASNHVPSWPASHGCIRMPGGFAEELFGLTARGMHVVIADEAVKPRFIHHPSLFQPNRSDAVIASLRETIDISQASPVEGTGDEEQSATIEPPEPLRIYVTRITRREITRHLQIALNELGHDAGEVDGLYGRSTAAAVISFQKANDLAPTGMLSDELLDAVYAKSTLEPPARTILYVRRGHEPLFEAPVELSEPEKPLGTHLFVASPMAGQSRSLEWYAVSPQSRIPRSVQRDHELALDEPGQKIATDPATALDRLEMDAVTRARIASLIVPGSSFAISDNGWGTETGKGTDFIVQIH